MSERTKYNQILLDDRHGEAALELRLLMREKETLDKAGVPTDHLTDQINMARSEVEAHWRPNTSIDY